MSNLTDTGESDFDLVVSLLAQPTPAAQFSLLQQKNLLNTDGLLRLLNIATALVRSDPGQARHLATLCAEAAAQFAIPGVAPGAAYIRAQTHALAGEFDAALTLITEARDGYLALGQTGPALRTTAGLMHVLGESGRYEEALLAGQEALANIARAAQRELTPLAALIQQNMGMCYTLTGQYEEALAAYQAAEAQYLDLGMTLQVGDISNNRGVLLWEMGRGSEALIALKSALTIRATAGQTMLQAQTLSNIGSAQLQLGNYNQSLAAFAEARHLFDALDVLVDQHVLLLDTANAYLTLNLYPEALTAYQEAERLLKRAGVVHQRARALWGLGATHLALGQWAAAEAALIEAAGLLEAASDGPTPLLVTILLEQAAVLAAQEKRTTAVSIAQHALSLVANQDWPVPAIYAHLQLADLSQPDLSHVETHLLAAEQLAAPFGLPHFRYRLQQRLGRLRRQQGRREEALALLETARAEVDRLRGSLAQETIRAAFLHDKTAVYDDLIHLHLSWGGEPGARHAFAAAEQAKSRALLDLVSGVIGAGEQAAGAEAAQLAALQADLNAVYNELLKSSLGEENGRRHATQERVAELESAISQLRLRLAATPTATPDAWTEPQPLSAIQSTLPERSALLVYHVIEEDILVFVVRRDGLEVRQLPGLAAEIPQQTRRLAGLLDRMRAGYVFNHSQIAALERPVRRLLQTIYQALVAPVADQLLEVETLTIIPHGPLHQLPFHALFDGERYLLERFVIAYAPSAAIFQHCQQRPASSGQRALVIGVSDPAIPAVIAEAKGVAGAFPQARLLLDEAATLAAFQAEAAGCDLLHLACHGLFRADSPMFSSLKLHDGWLTAADAMRLRLRDALVVLSACESGRSQVRGGDELLGLIRAFFGAGAATVVVSLWLAQDEAAAALMTHWYEALSQPGMGPAAALRAAQLALMAEYPHPFFWAPFIAVGRR